MNIYVTREGQNYGPYPAESAVQMVQQGQLSPNDLACPEGAAQWAPLGQILGMAPAAPAVAVAPSAVSAPRTGTPGMQPAAQTSAAGALLAVSQFQKRFRGNQRAIRWSLTGCFAAVLVPVAAILIQGGETKTSFTGRRAGLERLIYETANSLGVVGSILIGVVIAAVSIPFAVRAFRRIKPLKAEFASLQQQQLI